ncbi:MAG: riboflavin kinase/FMN adenylyltransferase [Flammeovirgaceae bacterium]|jgi:riboflavin kinase/FMN adenylyltransferase
MQIHYGLENFQKLERAIVTSGTFDGVHIGHQKILKRLTQVAEIENGESVVLTFWPHPRLVLFPEQTDLKLLSDLDEKAVLLEKFGIDHLVVIKFDKEFSKTTSQEFIHDILVDKIGTHRLVIGYDHKFGRNREGGFDYLKENSAQFGFEVEEIPRQDIDDVGVSSTKVRKALLKGEVETANSYLNSEYMLTGTVVKGKQIGRTIGYPTANVAVSNPNKLIPENGIYAIRAEVRGKLHNGMLYIGTRPTLGDKLEQSIEANLFDFSADIYDEKIRIFFLKTLRGDQKFDGLESLKKQLDLDKEMALKVFGE